MKYFDSKEQKYLQQYLLEQEYLLNNNDFLPDSSEENTDGFNKKKVTTKINVDFFTETVKIYLVFPVKQQKKKPQKENEDAAQVELYKIEEDNRPQNRLIIDKEFKVADDFESLTIDGEIHIIPKYFNKENIKAEDEKTFEMIFYKIFNDEIMQELRKLVIKN